MRENDPLIRVDDVSLCYRLAKQRIPSFKEYAIHWIKGSLTYEELWAVKNVSFTLYRGESLGIIGRNGAGKSSLLKLISGVFKPTTGSIGVSGMVAPILELGTGFDHELTGLENIYLNALLLGRPRQEIDERVEEIVAFSGLAEFIQSPLRNYSTGMVARLGFSIATAWVPDVLILDEVLSVGDARFRARCEERIDSFRVRGTTLLMVSHSADSIREACDSCLWMEQGRVKAHGESDHVLEKYLEFSRSDP